MIDKSTLIQNPVWVAQLNRIQSLSLSKQDKLYLSNGCIYIQEMISIVKKFLPITNRTKTDKESEVRVVREMHKIIFGERKFDSVPSIDGFVHVLEKRYQEIGMYVSNAKDDGYLNEELKYVYGLSADVVERCKTILIQWKK